MHPIPRAALSSLLPLVLLASLAAPAVAAPAAGPTNAAPAAPPVLFETSHRCMACHNGLVTPAGEDVSIGSAWRASMMANSARDPYWQAAVRREALDHPAAAAAIEDECSACHMPMARFQAKAGGEKGQIFLHLPIGQGAGASSPLAADGASCTACHQITGDNFGRRESFTGGFAVDTAQPWDARPVYGPFAVDAGRTAIMHSAAAFRPAPSPHIQESELCATCHTLFTHALGPDGQVVGELPEQVPYLEWRHSAYRDRRSCQSCHMPAVAGGVPIASVWGEPREGFSEHFFQGGNFLMPRILNRHRAELGVEALPQELDGAARRTAEHLRSGAAAALAIARAGVRDGRLTAEVAVTNLAGHKLPTAYPSRRAWIRFVVVDAAGAVVFESGGFAADGRILGNDNDADAARYEPHHAEITDHGQVQVYESVMVDAGGAVTTGLLRGARYVKDNRILPEGFVKATADADVAVHGGAATDADFTAGGDRVRYVVEVAGARRPLRVAAELWYQPIAYRWAQNLRQQKAAEIDRFVSYYEGMVGASAVVLARAEAAAP